jgi:hypothetical protein
MCGIFNFCVKHVNLKIAPDGRVRDMATLEVGSGKPGHTQVSIKASSSTHNDHVTRTTKIVPKGFPYQLFASGLLKYEKEEGKGGGDVALGYRGSRNRKNDTRTQVSIRFYFKPNGHIKVTIKAKKILHAKGNVVRAVVRNIF